MSATAAHKKRTLTGSEIHAYSRNRFEDRTLRSRVRNLTEQAQVSHDHHQKEIINWRSFRRESKKHSGFWCNPPDEAWAVTPRAQQTQQSQFSDWNEDIRTGNRFSQAVSQSQTPRDRSPSTDNTRSLFTQNEALSRIQKPWAYTYSMESYNSVYTEALQFAKGQEKRLFLRRAQSSLSPRPNTVQGLELGVSQLQRNSNLAQTPAATTSLRRPERFAQRPHTGRSTPGISLSTRQNETNPSSLERPKTCIGAKRSVEDRTENRDNNAGGGSVDGDAPGVDNIANNIGADDNRPNTNTSNDSRPKTITLKREMSISMIFDEEDCTTTVVEPLGFVDTKTHNGDERLQIRDFAETIDTECAREHSIEEEPSKNNMLTNADSASDAVINDSHEEDKAETKADDLYQNSTFENGLEIECSNLDWPKELSAETRETSNEEVFSEPADESQDVIDFGESERKSNRLVHAATGTFYSADDRAHKGEMPSRKLSKRTSVSEDVTTVQIGKKVSISLVHSEHVLQQDTRVAQGNGTKRRESRKNSKHGHFVRNDDQETHPGSTVSVSNSLMPTQSEQESGDIQLSVNVRRDKLTQSRSAPTSPRSRDKMASLVISEETMILSFQPSNDSTAAMNEKKNGAGPARSRRNATTVMPVYFSDNNENHSDEPIELPVLRADSSTRSNVIISSSTSRQRLKAEKGVHQDDPSSAQVIGDTTTGSQRNSHLPSGHKSMRGTTPTQINADKVSTHSASRRRQSAGLNPIVHATTSTVNSTGGSTSKGDNAGKTRMTATSSSRLRTAERGDVVTGSASSEAKNDSLTEPKLEIDLRPSSTGQDINLAVHATTGTVVDSTGGSMRKGEKASPKNGRSSRGRSYHENTGPRSGAQVAQNDTAVTQGDTIITDFENTISTVSKLSSANELNSRQSEREHTESPSSRPSRVSMSELNGGQTLEPRPQTSIGSPGLRSRSEGSHIYSDDVSCYSGDSDYTTFRGFYIRNYVRPQERYKADPFLTGRRERTMMRLALENPVFLNGSRTDIKAEVIFPKTARRKVLQELVAKNSTPVRKTDKGVVSPELRAKIDQFFKTLEPLCPKPDFVLE